MFGKKNFVNVCNNRKKKAGNTIGIACFVV